MAEKFNLSAQRSIQRHILGLSRAKQTIRRELGSQSVKLQVDTRRAERQLDRLNSKVRASKTSLASIGSQQNLAPVTRGFSQANRSAKNFSHSIELATRRYSAFVAGAGTAMIALRKFNTSLRESVKLESSITKLAQVASQPLSSLRELQSEIRGVATEYGAASSKIAEAAVTLKVAGFSLPQIEQTLPTLAQTSLSPTFENLESVADGIIVLRNIFGQETGKGPGVSQKGSLECQSKGVSIGVKNACLEDVVCRLKSS